MTINADIHPLMCAVLHQAVLEAKGEGYVGVSTQADQLAMMRYHRIRKERGQEAVKWLAYNGPEWAAAVGLGLLLPAFRDWLDERADFWDAYDPEAMCVNR